MHHYCDDYVMLLLRPGNFFFLAQARNKTRRDNGDESAYRFMSEMWANQTKPYADEVNSGSSRFLWVPASLETNRGLSSKPSAS